jgi:hypothetical protein
MRPWRSNPIQTGRRAICQATDLQLWCLEELRLVLVAARC